MRPMFRPDPALPMGAMKTYAIDAPADTHWRPGSCADVGCPHYVNGWSTTVIAGSDDELLLRNCGRHWFLVEDLPGGFRRFSFSPGQPCFKAATHRVRSGRPEIYTVRGGDWRGSTGLIRQHRNADDWVDDFAEHQDNLATRIARG